ncbi:MAG: transglutaminase domain-containing protein [Oscillospiraceae bacterium]|nr:transglutaminase domain-containing protein [Oscillospiraceae bacterium]
MQKCRWRPMALLLCSALFLALCGCGDEDFSSSAEEADFSSETIAEWSQAVSALSQEELSSSSESVVSAPESGSAAGETVSAQSSPAAAEPSVSSQAVSSTADPAQPSTAPQPQAESAGSYTVLTPVASGTVVYSGATASIDASNTSEGYVMVRYSGSVSKIRVQITRDGGSTYTYALNNSGSYEVFPLSQGSGNYSINVYENVSGDQYSLALGQSISASLRNSFLPFLYPNQYVNFNSGSQTVAKGARLASTASSDLGVVENIYNYVIHNITYDFNKAASVSFGYLPNVDSILNSGTGICFDYAAVMATMLRTQNIPTKLVVGYAGNIYHAWISTYITDVGWVNGIIYFDGQSWKRMDPTFASSGNESADIMNYIGNGSNYNAMYVY